MTLTRPRTYEESLELVRQLEARPTLTREEMLLLGNELYSCGQWAAAERWLLAAAHAGLDRSHLKLLMLLMGTGRDAELIAHYQQVEPLFVDEDDRLLARRYLGIAHHRLGHGSEGELLITEAYHGFLARQNWQEAAIAAQNLGVINHSRGLLAKAEALLLDARDMFLTYGCVSESHLESTLITLSDLYFVQGRVEEGAAVLRDYEERQLGRRPRSRAWFNSQLAVMYRAQGNYPLYLSTLFTVHEWARRNSDMNLLPWTTVCLADHYSAIGDAQTAWRELYAFPAEIGQDVPAAIQLGQGIVLRRQGNLDAAIAMLESAREYYSRNTHFEWLCRSMFELAYTRYQNGDWSRGREMLHDAIAAAMRCSPAEFAPVLHEMRDMLYHAALDPVSAAFVEPVLTFLRSHQQPQLPTSVERVQVELLRKPRVLYGGQELAFSYRSAASVLVYLWLNPGSTRQQLQAALFPSRDPQASAAYVRKAIAEIREHLGPDAIVCHGSGVPTYRIGQRLHLTVDLQQAHEALAREDLAAALAIVGERDDGIHIEDESWLAEARHELVAQLGQTVSRRLEQLLAERAWSGAILLATHYLRLDPWHRDTHEARLRAAREVGQASELRQYQLEMDLLEREMTA